MMIRRSILSDGSDAPSGGRVAQAFSDYDDSESDMSLYGSPDLVFRLGDVPRSPPLYRTPTPSPPPTRSPTPSPPPSPVTIPTPPFPEFPQGSLGYVTPGLWNPNQSLRAPSPQLPPSPQAPLVQAQASPQAPLVQEQQSPQGVVVEFPDGVVVRTDSRRVNVVGGFAASYSMDPYPDFRDLIFIESPEIIIFPSGGRIIVCDGSVFPQNHSFMDAPDGCEVVVPVGGVAEFFLTADDMM